MQIEIKKLKKSYGSKIALNEVSCSIQKGSMNFLLGANGSGKSTLLKCLAGHEIWQTGDISIDGLSRLDDRKNFNGAIHFISEDIAPPPVPLATLKSLYQNIYEKWDDEIFQRYLKWSNLSLSQDLMSVSRGQKIQALLALALSVQPEILLIDEATAVLDPFIRNRFINEISRRNKSAGMTVVIATNIGSEISVLNGRLLIMREGQFIVDRSSDNIAEGLIKIRANNTEIESPSSAGFVFLGQNSDHSLSFIGQKQNLEKVKAEYQMDLRSITVEEIFIFYSDRAAL